MSGSNKHKTKHKKQRPVRIALTILALTLSAALLLCAVLLIAPLTERVDAVPVEGAERWMGRLDDAALLNELFLPGTHCSAAQYTPRAFFTKCQALDIGAQLRAGYRCLDLRLGSTAGGDGFLLLCGAGACKTGLFGSELSLDDTLSACYAFLEENATETVLLLLRADDESMSVRSVQLLLDAYIREAPQYWLLTDRVPTLGEARGKLVLLRGWEDEIGLCSAAGIPCLWRDQSGAEDVNLNAAAQDQGSYMLWVQDRSDYDADAKWAAFLGGVRSTENGAVSLNILGTTGEGAYGHPYEYARDLNARLMDVEDSRLGGWILVDFGSSALAERIYRLNF